MIRRPRLTTCIVLAGVAPISAARADAVPQAVAAVTSEAAPSAKRWYDAVDASAFVDAYASVNYGLPRPQASEADLGGGNALRVYDRQNGFALAWVGANASVAPEPVGATLSLRFGPQAYLHNASDVPYGLAFVKQAFVTGKPHPKVTLDFGKFDQPFGSEQADSQLNPNYTRSLLYGYAQPVYFTGVRADWAVSERLDVKVIAANGWNNSVDMNVGKSVGGQIAWTPAPELTAYAGYVGGPEQADFARVACGADTEFDSAKGACAASPGAQPSVNVAPVAGANSRWRHLADVVVDYKPSAKLRLLANADYGTEARQGAPAANWYGVNLAVRYRLTRQWEVAARGEHFVDEAGFMTAAAARTIVSDGTLTLGWLPTRFMRMTLDNRVDIANAPLFRRGASGLTTSQVTTTLGLVVTSAPLD